MKTTRKGTTEHDSRLVFFGAARLQEHVADVWVPLSRGLSNGLAVVLPAREKRVMV